MERIDQSRALRASEDRSRWRTLSAGPATCRAEIYSGLALVDLVPEWRFISAIAQDSVFEPDGKTFVDIYLKSRGFKETARSKANLKAISTSAISLYEVSEVVPGKSFLARDLLRGGDPVEVTEGTATRTLRQWEKIAARIVHVGGTNVITGGVLPYSMEASEALLEGLKEFSGKKKRSRKKLILDDDTLRLAAPLFTHAWLFDTLPKVLGDSQPLVCNSDGDDIVFHEVRFPIEVDITGKVIADRFAGRDDLRQENPQFWNWLGRPPAKGTARPGHPDALVAGVTMEDGTPVLGNLEIKGRFLVLMVNSAERAQRGAELVQNILGKMVRAPHHNPDHRTAESRASGQKAIGRRYPARSRNSARPRHARQAISRYPGRAGRHARRYLATRSSPHQNRPAKSRRMAQISRNAVIVRTKPARPHGHLRLLMGLERTPRRRSQTITPCDRFLHVSCANPMIAQGLPISKINPRLVRRFAEATGRLAKTDRVDAELLARYGLLLDPRLLRKNTHVLNDLKELHVARWRC
ncbi:Transposase [Rhizobium tibeticum]|uniref:Transposase n=1 Tax=Rhizobium tibeticum TaxID=501024 RepID=A0A1H8W2W3_9HYPH|nr:hypothetical protein [Rhizobium tibeticum]SEI19952.1 Transposase [Rhizobium tibeticum]SEP21863.1 Transposase [Rhizobium tibeticum]